jgi:hypothetical protein
VAARTANAMAVQMVPAGNDVFMIGYFLYKFIAVEQLIGLRGDLSTGDVLLAAVVGLHRSNAVDAEDPCARRCSG